MQVMLGIYCQGPTYFLRAEKRTDLSFVHQCKLHKPGSNKNLHWSLVSAADHLLKEADDKEAFRQMPSVSGDTFYFASQVYPQACDVNFPVLKGKLVDKSQLSQHAASSAFTLSASNEAAGDRQEPSSHPCA